MLGFCSGARLAPVETEALLTRVLTEPQDSGEEAWQGSHPQEASAQQANQTPRSPPAAPVSIATGPVFPGFPSSL